MMLNLLNCLASLISAVGNAIYVEYRPNRSHQLPTSFVIEGRRVIPEYDFQGHSASIEWAMANQGNTTARIAVESPETQDLVWHLHTEAGDCFILLVLPENDAIDHDDDEHDPLLEPDRDCKKLLPHTRMISDFLEMIPPGMNAFVHGLSETVQDVVSFHSATWLSLVACVVLSGWISSRRKRSRRSEGMVRISFFDPERKAEIVELPSQRFPSEALSDVEILRAMERYPEVSSFSLFLTD